MCGIAGFYGDFDRAILSEMALRIAHRGPDDEGIEYEAGSGVGLVHRRLSIQDLSAAGHQPMWDRNKKVCLVYNGEIYNFQALRKELQGEGFDFNGHSDSEVLLNLYLRDGVDLLPKLNGIFAFAIWDGRNNSLFIAKDGLGVKPLYFAEPSAGFLFASELKALLAYPELSRELDSEAVYRHLVYLWNPAPSTLLKSVKKLEPGHAMLVSEGRVSKTWRFYDLPYGRQEIYTGTSTEAALAVEEAVRVAVERQLVSDVPVGAFLSGGLDSSAIVAFAQKSQVVDRLQCFTIGWDDADKRGEGFSEDLPYAKRVAKYLGVDLHTVKVDSHIIDRLDEMIYFLDEPQADPAPLNVLLISELARSNGIKVLLSGAGGDDIFSGYRRHWALQQERYWAWLPESTRRVIANLCRRLPVGHPILRRISKALGHMDMNENRRLVNYFFWLDSQLGRDLFSDNVKEELKLFDPADSLLSSLKNIPGEEDRLNQMLYLETKHFLADHNLNYTDKMSMAAGIEVRVPLLDPDLVSLATSLPSSMKQHGNVGKWIFKRAMESHLPSDVIYRPKTGFGAPLRSWLRNELRPLVDDVLSAESLQRRGLFNWKSVQRLRELDRDSKVDAAYPIFSLVCIELWCRRFVDQGGQL